LTIGQIGGCLSFAVLLAAGQILFKSAAISMPAIRGISDLGTAIGIPVLWLAILLYGAATLLWIFLLQTIPLSRAYPFAAIGFVLVPLAGIIVFGEKVTVAFVVGAALIVSGLLVMARA
jgi:multidrug transporter EmrE-like cation transporter